MQAARGSQAVVVRHDAPERIAESQGRREVYRVECPKDAGIKLCRPLADAGRDPEQGDGVEQFPGASQRRWRMPSRGTQGLGAQEVARDNVVILPAKPTREGGRVLLADDELHERRCV